MIEGSMVLYVDSIFSHLAGSIYGLIVDIVMHAAWECIDSNIWQGIGIYTNVICLWNYLYKGCIKESDDKRRVGEEA